MRRTRQRPHKYELLCPIEKRAGRWYVSTRIGVVEPREVSYEAITVNSFDVVDDVPTEIDGAYFDAVIRTREPSPRFYGVVHAKASVPGSL